MQNKHPRRGERLFHSSHTLCSVWRERGESGASPPRRGGGTKLVQVCSSHHQIFPGLLGNVLHGAGHRRTVENQVDVVPVFVSLSVTSVCAPACVHVHVHMEGWRGCFMLSVNNFQVESATAVTEPCCITSKRISL